MILAAEKRGPSYIAETLGIGRTSVHRGAVEVIISAHRCASLLPPDGDPMHSVYALEQLPDPVLSSLFLAGPTPRDPETPSWSPEALRILADLGYGGAAIIPEPRSGECRHSYVDQTSWEVEMRARRALRFGAKRIAAAHHHASASIISRSKIDLRMVLLPPQNRPSKQVDWGLVPLPGPNQHDNEAPRP